MVSNSTTGEREEGNRCADLLTVAVNVEQHVEKAIVCASAHTFFVLPSFHIPTLKWQRRVPIGFAAFVAVRDVGQHSSALAITTRPNIQTGRFQPQIANVFFCCQKCGHWILGEGRAIQLALRGPGGGGGGLVVGLWYFIPVQRQTVWFLDRK